MLRRSSTLDVSVSWTDHLLPLVQHCFCGLWEAFYHSWMKALMQESQAGTFSRNIHTSFTKIMEKHPIKNSKHMTEEEEGWIRAWMNLRYGCFPKGGLDTSATDSFFFLSFFFSFLCFPEISDSSRLWKMFARGCWSTTCTKRGPAATASPRSVTPSVCVQFSLSFCL